ncbi:MAG: acyl-CoA reductase, partial [Sediminibacterium sp.]
MRRSGGAVILMQQDFNDITFLFPSEMDMNAFIKQPADEPFSDNAVSFLQDLSHELAKDIRNYPEVAALAFFCRKASVLQLKQKYNESPSFRLGRGIAFHITPSNVPLNFAYSLVTGILSGNNNIVRAPSKDFEQVRIFCEAIERVNRSGTHAAMLKKILLVRYSKQSTATAYFSSICDVRIIWGGDDTIAEIRKNSIGPRAFDITFADRYSLAIINADIYIQEQNPAMIAAGFYNDTYLYDQNACTSPHLIIWLGNEKNVQHAKEVFWNELHKVVLAKYKEMQSVIAVDKLTAFYSQASTSVGISKITTPDNYVWRVELQELPSDISN